MGGERQTPAPVALMCRAGMSDAGLRPNTQTKAGGGGGARELGGGEKKKNQGGRSLLLISLILSLFPQQLIDTDEGDRAVWFFWRWGTRVVPVRLRLHFSFGRDTPRLRPREVPGCNGAETAAAVRAACGRISGSISSICSRAAANHGVGEKT